MESSFIKHFSLKHVYANDLRTFPQPIDDNDDYDAADDEDGDDNSLLFSLSSYSLLLLL